MEGLGGVARPQWSSWAPLLSMDSTPTPWNCWCRSFLDTPWLHLGTAFQQRGPGSVELANWAK